MAFSEVITILLIVIRLNLVNMSPLPPNLHQMECGVLPADLCDADTGAEYYENHNADYSVTQSKEDQMNNLSNLKSLFESTLTAVDSLNVSVEEVRDELDAVYPKCTSQLVNGTIFYTATQESMEQVVEMLNLTSGWLKQMSELGKHAAAAEHEDSEDQIEWFKAVGITEKLQRDLGTKACESQLRLSTGSASIPSCLPVSDSPEASALWAKLQRIVYNRICVLLSTNATTEATVQTTSASASATSSPGIVHSV